MKWGKLLLVAFSCLMILSCDVDPWEGKRPLDYENSVWIADDPYLYVEYGTDGELIEAYLFEQNSIHVKISYGQYDDSVVFLDLNDDILLKCHAQYLNSQCILTVSETNVASIDVGVSIELNQVLS